MNCPYIEQGNALEAVKKLRVEENEHLTHEGWGAERNFGAIPLNVYPWRPKRIRFIGLLPTMIPHKITKSQFQSFGKRPILRVQELSKNNFLTAS